VPALDAIKVDPAVGKLYFRVTDLPVDGWLAIYAVLPPATGEPESTFLGLLELEQDTAISKAVSIPRTVDGSGFLAVSLRFVLESPPPVANGPVTSIGIIRDQDAVSSTGQRPVAGSLDLKVDATMRAEAFVALVAAPGGAQ
jgi:hypothetical protein